MALRRPAHVGGMSQQARQTRGDAVVLTVWALVAFGSLASFDVLPVAGTGLLLTAVTAAGMIGLVLHSYLQRPNAPSGISPRLLTTLGVYHLVVLGFVAGGFVLVLDRVPTLLGILCGVIAATPVVLVALRLWGKARLDGEDERW